MEKPATNGVTGAEHLGLVPAKFKPAKPGGKRKFPLEFKKACVDRVQHGETVAEVAKATGVHNSQLHRWIKGESLNSMGGGRSGRKARSQTSQNRKALRKASVHKQHERASVRLENKPVKDAIFYLRQAEKWCYQSLREGRIDSFDQAHDFARQALRELEKL